MYSTAPSINGWHLADLAPGLWVALLALGLDWALRRWYDAVPARVTAIFALVLALLLAPVLVGGRILLPVEILTRMAPWQSLRPLHPELANRLQLDLVSQITPNQALVRRAVHAGEWPLWNPHSGAGMPLMADPQAQFLQPLAVLAWPLPLPQAAAATAALRVWIALVFAFLWLRREGRGELPALAGSLAFGLGGFLILWLGWPIANSATFLPVLLYAIARTDDLGSRRDYLLLTVAVFSLLLAGQPETSLNDLLLGGAFALARLAWQRRRRAHEGAAQGPTPPGPRSRGKLLAGWLAAGGLAAGLAAPLLLPAADYLPQTHRNTRIEIRNRQLRQESPWDGWQTASARSKSARQMGERLLAVAAPNAWGNHRFGPYWGYDNINEDAAGFAGGLALLAALLTLAPLAAGESRFRDEHLCQGVAALCLVVVARPPGMARLLVALPLLGKSATFQHRLLLPFLLAVAYLAACTLERWQRQGLRRGPLGLAALSLLAVVLFAYLRFSVPTDPGALAGLRHWSLLGQSGVLVATALVLGWRRYGQAPSRRQAVLVVALVAGELLAIHGPANPGQHRSDYWPTTPAVAFLQKHLAPHTGIQEGERVTALGWSFQPNAAALYDLSDARYTNPLLPWNVAVVLRPLVDEMEQVNELYYPLEHPLYDFLGVRYGLVPENVALPAPWRLVFAERSAWIYERPDPLPRFFLPDTALRLPGYPWPRWMSARREFASTVLLAPRPGEPERWSARLPASSSPDRLDLESAAAAQVRLRSHLGEPRVLASSHYQDGGWKLLVDGRRQPTELADGPFLAARLPAGDHRLDLLYRPRTLLPACLLAALALAAALLAFTPPPRSLQ